MGFTTDSFDRRGWALGPVRASFVVWTAVLVGSILGFLVSVDALVLHWIPDELLDVQRQIPFALTFLLVVAIAVASAFANFRRRLFARRFDVTLVGIMVAVSVSGIGGTLETTDVALPLALLLWLFAAIVEQRPIRVPLPALILALLFAIGCVGSIVNLGSMAISSLVSPAKMLLLAFLVADLIDGQHRCRLAIRWFVLLAVILAAVALFTGILDTAAGVSMTAWDDAKFQAKETPFGKLMRATAFLPTAQVLAHFLILGVALLLPFPVRPIWKVLGVLLLSVGILWTFSSGAYLLLALTLLAWLFLRRPERSIHYAVILIGLVVLGYMVGVSDWLWNNGLSDLGSDPAQDRVVQMRNSVSAIAQHPVLGAGVSAWIRSPGGSVHVHNSFLEAASEVGIPATLVLIGMLLSLVIAAAILITRLPDGEDRDRCKGVLLGTIALMIHWNAEPFLFCAVSWLFIGIGTGVVTHYGRELRRAKDRMGSTPAPTANPGRPAG